MSLKYRAQDNPGKSNSESPAKEHQRFEALDGLRALALLSVIIHHYTPAVFLGGTAARDFVLRLVDLGGLGVDLFFVLSGFLITGILYDSVGSTNFFGRFYWRRSLRIFPAYFAFLVPFLFAPHLFSRLSRWWFILYLRNWMGPDSASDQLLGHLWSLAVEEQFYIFWAVAVYFCPKRNLPSLIVGLSAMAFCFRGGMIIAGYSRYDQLRFTFARIDALLAGGLIAVAWRNYRWTRVKETALWCAVVFSIGFAAILTWKGTLENRLAELLLPSFSAVFFASAVALALNLRRSILIHSSLAHIAKYSYAIYLWHLAPHVVGQRVLRVVEYRWTNMMPIARLLYVPSVFAIAYLVARISWTTIEKPFLSLKDWLFAHSSSSPK